MAGHKISNKSKVAGILKKLPTSKPVSKLKPMLATLVDNPFDSDEWEFEVKWDGYRALAFLYKSKVELRSRNDKSFNEKFYPLVQEFSKWKINAVIDGEIIVAGKNGISDFSALQNWRSEADGELIFYAFDILMLDNKDLTSLPLSNRRELLKNVIQTSENIRLSETFKTSGIDFFQSAVKLGLEGIIAKKSGSHYHPGLRSKEWLKIKANKRQEMVIGGYTVNEESGKLFSSLLVGVYENRKLVYTGKVGTGFSIKVQKEILTKLKSLAVKKMPFTYEPDINKPSRFRPNPPKAIAVWVKPKLVCEVSYAEITPDGIMRHPSFEGLRMDKNAGEVKWENEKSTKNVTEKNLITKKFIAPVKTGTRKTLLNPVDKTQVRTINGNELKFNNLSKIFWPKEKITKRDVINYYFQIAPYILPYLKNRPQAMNRHPDGINGESFYYKDVTGKAPDWIKTYRYHSESDDRTRNYLVATDEASLLYMASLGCIEINPWHSKVETEDFPDWCIIDLDPAKNSFEEVIEAANVTKEILDSLGIASYPKTSGSTGIHVYIPLGAKYTYEQSKELARVIARLVSNELPDFTSIKRAVKDRGGKMYIDFLQNRPHATVSSAYSLRPKPGAPVSMPLHWHEVKKGLKMTDFNIYNALERVKSEGDLFKPVIGKGIDLKKILKKFEQMNLTHKIII